MELLDREKRLNFRLRGRKFFISPIEVPFFFKGDVGITDSVKGRRSNYFVVVSGRKIPVKAALEKILRAKGVELSLLDFTTRDAVRVFRRLGFPIVKGEGRKSSLMRYVGALSLGGHAVKDKRRIP